jgi:hypothetical protein
MNSYLSSFCRLIQSLYAASSVLSRILLVLIFGLSIASAEDPTIENLVISSCYEAGMMVGHLPEDRLYDVLSSLVRAIRIGIQNGKLSRPEARPFPILSPGLGHGELSGDVVVMSLDPERNDRARRCIFDILRTFIDRSPLVIRDLIALADDLDIAPQHPEIRKDLVSIVLDIAARDTVRIRSADRILILDQLISSGPIEIVQRWRDLFKIWKIESSQLLVRRFFEERIDPNQLILLGLLAESDPRGNETLSIAEQVIATSLDSERREKAIQLINALNPPAERLLSSLIFASAYGFPDDARSLVNSVSYLVKDNDCSEKEKLNLLDPDFVFDALLREQYQLWEGLRLSRQGVVCPQQCELINLETGFSKLWCDPRFLNTYRERIDEVIEIDAAKIGVILESFASLAVFQSELVDMMQKLLHSDRYPVRISAVSLYAQFSSDRGRFVSDVLRLLKRPTILANEKREILLVLARSFVTPPIEVKGLPAVPFFLDLMDESVEECGKLCIESSDGASLISEAIGAVGNSAFPMLIRSLGSTNVYRRKRAIYALSRMKQFDKKMAFWLVSALRDPVKEIHEGAVEMVFKKMDIPEIAPEVEKASRWSDKEAASRARSIIDRYRASKN